MIPKNTYISINTKFDTKNTGINETCELQSKKVVRTHIDHSVEILGPSKLFYGGNDKPILPCGARVVIETESDLKIDNIQEG